MIQVEDSVGSPLSLGHVTVSTDPPPAIGPLARAPGKTLRLGIDGSVTQELGVYTDGRSFRHAGGWARSSTAGR